MTRPLTLVLAFLLLGLGLTIASGHRQVAAPHHGPERAPQDGHFYLL